MSAKPFKSGYGAAPRISVMLLPGGTQTHAACTASWPEEAGGPLVEVLEAKAVFVDKAPGSEPRALSAPMPIALNLAASGTRGEILAFLGRDLEPAPGWAQAIAAFFDEHPEADLATGRTLLQPATALAIAEAALEDGSAVVEDGAIRIHSSLHCAVRREAFVRTGGFDEAPPSFILGIRPLGSLLAGRQSRATAPDRMVAYREPSDRLAGLLRRQFRMGRAAYYAPWPLPVGVRVGAWLAAPARAVRLAGRRAQWPATLANVGLGMAAQVLGTLTGLLCGGRRTEPIPSPVVGPESSLIVLEDAPQAHPAASVVVPVHSRPEWLAICLGSLVRQDFAEPYEILTVLDDQDGFAAEIKGTYPKVRVCLCDAKRGVGGARNEGIAAARGDYVAFTDDDCLPAREWLRHIVEACRANGGRPATGTVEIGEAGRYLDRAHNLGDHARADPRGMRRAASVSGGNMCISRQLLEQSGAAFAEGVFGAEEIALVHRLPPESRLSLRHPGARVRHLRADSLKESLRHAYRLGLGSGMVRKRLRMRGSVFARHVWLVPLLPPVRFALTAVRTARHGPRAVADFIRLSPITACRYVWYAAGFAAGALSVREGEEPAPPLRRAEHSKVLEGRRGRWRS